MIEDSEELTLKEELLNLIEELYEGGFNFEEDVATFMWNYQEHPDIVFELLVMHKNNIVEEPNEVTVH